LKLFVLPGPATDLTLRERDSNEPQELRLPNDPSGAMDSHGVVMNPQRLPVWPDDRWPESAERDDVASPKGNPISDTASGAMLYQSSSPSLILFLRMPFRLPAVYQATPPWLTVTGPFQL
jgi:hypothetical protein